jgi:hypothetical protein
MHSGKVNVSPPKLQHTPVKFCIWGLHLKLAQQFNFGGYQSVLTPTSDGAQIQLYEISQK